MRAFIAKLLGFLLLLGLCQTGVYAVYHAPRYPEEFRHAETLIENDVPILYFGDSTLSAVCLGETRTARLVDFMSAELDEYDIGFLGHDAFHTEVYAPFCRFMLRRGARPEAVVIPINLRSFSAQWHPNPRFQFAKLRYLLAHDHLLARFALQPLAVFRGVNLTPISQQEADAAMVYDGERAIASMGELTRLEEIDGYADRQRNLFIYSYLYPLAEDHPKLVALVEAVRAVQAMGAVPLVYVTPIDGEAGALHYGPEFPDRIAENVAVIQRLLDAEGVDLLDLSQAAPSAWFCYGRGLDEHLSAEGLEFLTNEIAARLRQSLDDGAAGNENGRL